MDAQDPGLPASLEQPERSTDVWFTDDRTIIVKAESTLFRVYAGLLIHQSSVFGDMFSVPQPNDAEKIDGCPVVRLQDTADEARLFLQVLHDPIEYHRALSRGEDIIILLKMSHKYEAWSLHRQLLEYLDPMFPSHGLEEFIESEAETALSHAPFNYHDFDFNVGIANIARVIGAHHLLPVALYRLCRTSPPIVHASKLSTDNLVAVLVGRSHLAKRARDNSFSFLFRPIFYPKGPGVRINCPRKGCSAETLVATGTLASFMGKLFADDCWLDPLARCNLSFPSCNSCSDIIQIKYEQEQEYSWRHLPKFFGLGASWDELEGDCESRQL